MRKNLTIGYVLAGRQHANRPFVKKHFVKPFTAPLVLQVLAGMVSEIDSSIEHLGWDELLKGEVNQKFIEQVDLIFLSGLSTAIYGMERIAQLARKLGKPVIAGGMGITCRYFGDPGVNLPELLSVYDSVCIGRATPRIIAEIIQDYHLGTLKPMYAELPNEPVYFPIPRHDLFKGRYLFNNVLQSSTGCSSACNFCVVHRCLPNGRRGCVYLAPGEVIDRQLAAFSYYGGGWFFDGADSFGENLDHTYEVVLPRYARYPHGWITEAKISVLKGADGRWELLKAMAKAGNIITYAGFEDLFNKFTSKQASLNDIEEFIRIARNKGIIPIGSIMLDAATDASKEDIERTINWVCSHKIDVQFSLSSALESSDLWKKAIRESALIDINPEHADGAWPQVEHPNMSPEQRIISLASCYQECYSFREIFSRLRSRGFSCNSILAALVGLGVRSSARSWFKTRNYLYWLENRILPEDTSC